MVNKVLLLAKELVSGECISEYIKRLAVFLSEKNIEVHIVCFGNPPSDKIVGQMIHIHRVPLLIHGDNLFNWSMLMNNELKRRAREIFEGIGFDVIHSNDWVTSASAISLAKFTEKPLIVTMHSTEKERGFGAKHSGVISDMEWWLTYEASCVLANNERTFSSLRYDFQLPEEKLRLINPLKGGWQDEVLRIYESVERKTEQNIEKEIIVPRRNI